MGERADSPLSRLPRCDLLELGFATKGLRRVCEQTAKARQELGAEAAAALQRRLADMEAAEAIADLPWVPVTLSDGGEGLIEFYPGYALRFVAVPRASARDQKTDWAVVDRLKLMDIIEQ